MCGFAENSVCRVVVSYRHKKMIGALCVRQNFSLSRVCARQGQIRLLKSDKWKENGRKFMFWISQVKWDFVLAVNYWMKHLGIHFFPPLFFLLDEACANSVPWQLCFFSFSRTTCQVGNPWAVKPNTWVPVRWLCRLNYRWISASQQCSCLQDMYHHLCINKCCCILYRWHMKLYTHAFNPVWFWMIKFQVLTETNPLFLFFSHVAHSGILLQLAAISPCGKRPFGAQKGMWFIHIFPLG